jgi:thiamine pyrophosphate-dependent acetolactate synthase large subunit-like protein
MSTSNQKKVSDLVADFLEEKGIKHVFGIIGAGNAHLFDSIYHKGYTEIICVHHEQAACMAIQTYYRTTGKISAALLTTGRRFNKRSNRSCKRLGRFDSRINYFW